MAPVTVLAASTARQALIPMAAGYLILMSALALGLYRLYRPKATRAEDGQSPGGSSPGPSPAGPSPADPSPADPSPADPSRQAPGSAAAGPRWPGA